LSPPGRPDVERQPRATSQRRAGSESPSERGKRALDNVTELEGGFTLLSLDFPVFCSCDYSTYIPLPNEHMPYVRIKHS